MPDLGPQAAFIWASYAIVATVLGALIAHLITDGKRLAAELARLDGTRVPKANS